MFATIAIFHFCISLYHFQGPLCLLRVIVNIVIFTTGNSQWHFNESLFAIFLYLFIAFQKSSIWRTLQKLLLSKETANEFPIISVPLTAVHACMPLCNSYKHDYPCKTARGGTIATKEEAFREEIWDWLFPILTWKKVVGNIWLFYSPPKHETVSTVFLSTDVPQLLFVRIII